MAGQPVGVGGPGQLGLGGVPVAGHQQRLGQVHYGEREQVADRAERIARSITDEDSKADALAGVAKILAATDPDRAERIARSITEEYGRVVKALVWIAEA